MLIVKLNVAQTLCLKNVKKYVEEYIKQRKNGIILHRLWYENRIGKYSLEQSTLHSYSIQL